MIKLTYLREEDYWLIPLSGLGALLLGACFYASVLSLRLPAGLMGLAILYFTTYIIRRGYNKHTATLHVLLVIILAIALALTTHLLTN